ncbi:autophagy-related protein 16-like [Salvia splendens]|uniref:autophagy-related protein 16-like n=1 Tax=Salvia splendens TaxID=180675 RepID=UPI001C27B387|nr:autophagy-related protein 16-like [Salvia splendens]
MAQGDAAMDAIKHALKALRKRHLVEEGAHSPAFIALSRPIVSQGSEWKEKAENLELELQQCYKAQSRLSEQLVVEVAESRTSKALMQEKETMISELQNELSQARDECSHLAALLEEKTKALDLLISEHQEVKGQLEATILRADNAEAENKMLIDRWMLEKMKDAERLNEANALYEDMVNRLKGTSMENLAHQQVDGVVRRCEEGAEYYVESTVPSTCRQRIPAHDGGCASILFEHNSSRLVSGGQDKAVKMWDTNTGSSTRTLYGCLGTVFDLCITHDNKSIIAASSSNTLYVWDVSSGRVRHTLTGHTDKVSAVDVSKVSNRNVVSAAYDRTIKVWDLQKGYCVNTLLCYSNCNALCFSMDGQTICSGHVNGNLRLWDIQTGKLLSEIAAHSSSAVTSLSLSRNGNMLLSSGRDNLHNLFDMRTLEICANLRGNGRVASNWSRSCLSPDDGYVAAGSDDGSVEIWSVGNAKIVSTLKEHTSPVLSCAWSELGKPLATCDKNGNICIWS